MTIDHSPNNPQQENYELQQDFLGGQQRQISNHLFEIGVISRLTNTLPSVGAKVDTQGLAQLDKVFVPSISYTKYSGRDEAVLSLVAISDAEDNSRTFTHFRLGMIDDTNTLFPYPNVIPEDAEAVHHAANKLIAAREEGLIPNLSHDLLSVTNPSYGIRKIQ